MAFRLLALAVPDPVKMEIKIAYPERDIMECTLVVIVFSVNAGVLADLDPPRIGPTGPNPLADMDPRGPYPLVDLDPPPRIWTP